MLPVVKSSSHSSLQKKVIRSKAKPSAASARIADWQTGSVRGKFSSWMIFQDGPQEKC